MRIKSKYRAKKTEIDGIVFDSRKEAKRYTELKLMEKAGIITDLELQVPYVILPAYRKNGKKIREIKYIADFVYWDTEKNKKIVEDVKGVKTEVYKIKKKLFEYKYGDLEIIEI